MKCKQSIQFTDLSSVYEPVSLLHKSVINGNTEHIYIFVYLFIHSLLLPVLNWSVVWFTVQMAGARSEIHMVFSSIIDAVLLFVVALSGIGCVRLYFCSNNVHSFNCLCLTNTVEVTLKSSSLLMRHLIFILRFPQSARDQKL